MSIVAFMASPAAAQEAKTLRILISQSPWLNAFVALVDEYQEETGTTFELDVTPFGGMVDKMRNSVRAQEGSYDLININAQSLAEMYAGGFLTPLKQLDANFTLPEGVLDFGSSAYWNATTSSFDPAGDLYGVPTNGNVLALYYRSDLYEKAGLDVPQTWDDLIANAKALHNPPETYGFVSRGTRESILFDFSPTLFSFGGSYFADPENGDYSVTLNSPQGLQALETFIALNKESGTGNPAALEQAELIQLLATGKAAQGVAVIAAVADLQDPNKSIVTDTIETALLPAGPGGQHASVAGHWMAGIPTNTPEANQQEALKFLKWFLEKDTQIAYVEAGGIPVRKDLADTKLAEDPSYRFIRAFSENADVAKMNTPLKEGVRMKEVISLYLNRALIGEISAKDALNGAASEAHQVLSAAGYKLTPPKML
ncbi:polyols ABC transporter substrate-binding protein [Pseudorhizobium pelagicum]|uniref:Polyols ABC transporter substrate-binding protein n=1 Tax=Pseudorhizobium pelagicum TaxID=1509405 RepID=A0A922P0G0_9HYPH|nr:polyols ABC transporter substrate-binding protein [Pseudorhizobium pelagicum]